MKKRLIAIIAACAMLVTAFAGIAAADEAAAEGEGFTVGYNFFGAGSFALLSLANNSEYAIKQLGDTPMSTNDNFQVEQIIADIENLCNAGCDGVLIWLPVPDLYPVVAEICAKYEVPFVFNDKVPDEEMHAALSENPFYVGAVGADNPAYGEAIADYAIEQGYTSVLIATATLGDPTDTPRLEAFKEKFEAAGGEILDTLNCENIDDATSKIENSLIVNDPDFIYGTGSDFGIAAVNALNNQDMLEDVAVLTSGLDSQAVEYRMEDKIDFLNGDFWACGYYATILLEAYLHGNQMLDADGNIPYVNNVQPFLFTPEDYELYQQIFLNEDPEMTPYLPEETKAFVEGSYDDLLAAMQSYSIEERAAAHGLK